MKNNFRKLLLLLLIIFYLGTAFGQKYSRIISLAPSLTKSLYYLKSQDKLIGCTSYCEIAKQDNKNIIASAIKVNLENVISLKPDLVIATTITNPETIEFIKKFGIKTEIFPSPKSFSEICNQFVRLGKLVNKEKLASSVISKSKSKIDSLKTLYNWIKPPKVFFQIGAKPLFTVTTNTFMNDYINFIGGVNIASGLKRGTITREYVITQNPDIIIIVTMGIIGIEEKETWEDYTSLNATKNKKIFIIDSNSACTPTPISFTETLNNIANFLK
jgi:iron complex transport system substrate-binding protein